MGGGGGPCIKIDCVREGKTWGWKTKRDPGVNTNKKFQDKRTTAKRKQERREESKVEPALAREKPRRSEFRKLATKKKRGREWF